MSAGTIGKDSGGITNVKSWKHRDGGRGHIRARRIGRREKNVIAIFSIDVLRFLPIVTETLKISKGLPLGVRGLLPLLADCSHCSYFKVI